MYGCCPDGVLAASDRSLSNCQTPEERCKSDGRYWNGTPKFECSDKSPKDECESEGKVWDGTACKSTDSGTTTGCPPATPHKCSDGSSCMMKAEECPGYQAPTGSTTTMTPKEKCDQKRGCWNQAKGSCNTYTTFGCCPGTTVPQKDEWGMNCPPECEAGEKWDESKYRCVASAGAHWSWLNFERLY